MSAVPFGPGIDIWRSCRFIGAMMRSLCLLPGGLGRFRKRFRLNRKTPAHLVGYQVHTRPRVWKRLHFSGHLCISDVDCKRRRYNQQEGGDSPVFLRTGVR